MSAPDTNTEKQKRRHATPLVGVGLAVAFGAASYRSTRARLFDVFEGAESPTDTETELQETSPPASEDAGAVDVTETDAEAGQSDAGE